MKYSLILLALITTGAFAGEAPYAEDCKDAMNKSLSIELRIEAGAMCKEKKEFYSCDAKKPNFKVCYERYLRKATEGDYRRDWIQELTLLIAAGK